MIDFFDTSSEYFNGLDLDDKKLFLLFHHREINFSIYTPCGVCFALYDSGTGLLVEMSGNETAIEHIQLMMKVNLIHGLHGHRVTYPPSLDDLDYINEQFGIVIHRAI